MADLPAAVRHLDQDERLESGRIELSLAHLRLDEVLGRGVCRLASREHRHFRVLVTELEVLERLEGSGPAWDPGSRVQPFTLTAIWDGRRLRIPALGTTFVRCMGNPRGGWMPAPLPQTRNP